MTIPVIGGKIELDGYYDRTNETDPTKNYDRHLYIAGRIYQSAEANEVQSNIFNRIRGISDSLFKDGDISRDARAIIQNTNEAAKTCDVMLESGAIYLRGAMRGVGTGQFTVSTVGTVVVGVWMIEEIVTSTDDPDLLDPAAGERGYQETGAERLRITPKWGWREDGTQGAEFFPIYYLDDGQLRAKEPPPNLDAVTQAIARYDVDSNGSNYVVNGMRVTRMPDDATTNEFVFNIDSGRARVNGFGISLNSSRRLHQMFTPDQKTVINEPHASQNDAEQEIKLNRTPIASVTSVSITKQIEEEVTHGSVPGSKDPLANSTVVRVVSVKQGGTTYTENTDYILTGSQVDWSPSGTEPQPSSKYQVIYQYIDSNVQPTQVTDTSIHITGAVQGTQVLVSYVFNLPRIDRLVIDEKGVFSWLIGVATDYNPVRPQVPSNVLALCQIVHAWTDSTYLINDGVRMVSMSTLEGMNNRLDTITDLVAQLNLTSDLNVRDNAAKKGVFVDPFTGDEQRDQGISQTAAIAGGCLQLPITGPALGVSSTPNADVVATVSCNYTLETVLSNTARTSDMKVNPYMTYAPFPATVVLNPQIDRWVDTKTVWLSPETRYFTTTLYAPWSFQLGIHGTTQVTGRNDTNEMVGSTTADAEFLRQISVSFVVNGFAPNEPLDQVLFDGISVQPTI